MNLNQLARIPLAFMVLAVLIAGCVPIQAPTPAAPAEAPGSTNTIEATFVCPDGTSLPAVFDNDAGTVTVTLPDGTYTLPQVVSASGARYSDETIVFWNKGDSAMVEINGEIIFQDCIAE